MREAARHNSCRCIRRRSRWPSFHYLNSLVMEAGRNMGASWFYPEWVPPPLLQDRNNSSAPLNFTFLITKVEVLMPT